MTRKSKAQGFLKTPKYPGGKKALLEYIQNNLQYPKEALEKRIQGVVEVEYFVDGIGRIKDARILKSIGYGCDEEALRLVRSLVYEKAINRGVKTLTRKTIRIPFKIPAKRVNYQLTPSKSKPAPTISKEKTYTITIDLKQQKNQR